MTPDELKKEAERIIRECLEGWYDPESKFEDDGRRFYSEADEIICRALRAAHDAALEKAAMTIEGHTFVCDKVATSVNELIEKVRALKIGDEA